jgi:hypothetical protein
MTAHHPHYQCEDAVVYSQTEGHVQTGFSVLPPVIEEPRCDSIAVSGSTVTVT